jgi:hypothetical protein
MVRGNWQRRVEKSAARRQDAKQCKQQKDEKKIFKRQASDLMSFLDQNANVIFRRQRHKQDTKKEKDLIIHIWIDTAPSSSSSSDDSSPPPMDELWHNEEEEQQHIVNKNKNNKPHYGKHYKKKSSHPRSKDSMDNNNNNNNNNIGEGDNSEVQVVVPKLCRSHFFFGKCSESSNPSKKKASSSSSHHHNETNCRYFHYPKNHNRLTDVLLQENPIENSTEFVSLSEASFPVSTMDNEPTIEAMDMVYYFSISTNELFKSYPDDIHFCSSSSSPISELIVEAMTSKHGCSIGSIVYFVVGDQFIYDRYRNGIVLEESELVVRERQKYIDINKNKTSDETRSIQSIPLSATILEYILTFLDDNAVASMTSVSRSWHREIGKQSGNLWRHLLKRRSWPIPTLEQGDEEDDGLSTLRGAFISHYASVRDVECIKTGTNCLLSRKSTNELVGCVRSFESSKGSPQANNQCVSVKIWSVNCFLAAYSQDSSLRLFDSVDRSGSSGERLCRELICHRIDPYKKTKKRKCKLVAMALDEAYIGCLLHVMDDITEGEAFILTVLSRDNFLIDDGSNDETTQVIDIGQSVINFLLSCDDVDHGLLQLHDFLSNDGDLEDIDVIVSQSLVGCGYGRFMVEVSVSIPIDDEESIDEEDGDVNTTLLFRKLFLFSSTMGAIIWMSDSCPSSRPFRPINEDMTLASVKMEDGGRYGSKIVSLSSVSPEIMNLSVDPGGNFNTSTLIQGSDVVRNQILVDDRWSLRQARKRPVVMLDNQVVVADNLVWDENGTKKSVISFYPIINNDNIPNFDTLDLIGNLEVCHLIALRTSHVVAICRVFESTPDATDVDIEELAGHWFGPGGTVKPKISSYAIVIDVESRSEIYRTCLVDDLGMHLGHNSTGLSATNGELPIQVAIDEDTVAVGLWWKGVILTGNDARKTSSSSDSHNQEDTSPSKCNKKTKKTKKSKKGPRKKDGFARGMSHSG